jgi:hypothetical protein
VDEAAALFVNADRVFLDAVPRSYGPPGTVTDVIDAVVLRPGPNRVLIKICEGSGASGFRFRFQDAAGDPVFLPVSLFAGELRLPARVVRRLPLQVVPGDAVQIELDVRATGFPPPDLVTVTETVPAGWRIEDAGEGTVAAQIIAWSVAPAGNVTLQYTVRAPGHFGDTAFEGQWSTGGPANAVGGDTILAGWLPSGFSADGFVTRWLLLGPYGLAGCGSEPGGCGHGALPCCGAPGQAALRADYLTDGVVTQATVRPYPGMALHTDFRIAAGSGLLEVAGADVNPGGVPRWRSWHAEGGDVDLGGDAFAGAGGTPLRGCMAYAVAYVHNETERDRPVFVALGSDDSAVVQVNGDVVYAANLASPGRRYAGPPSYQDRIGPVVLRPGENRVLVKVFQGWGPWNFAMRFQDEEGDPVFSGLRIELVSASGGPVAVVRRRLPPAVSAGETMAVSLDVAPGAGAEITVEDRIPPGWHITDAGTGTGLEDRIRWTGITSGQELSYLVTSDLTCLDGGFAASIQGASSVAAGGDAVVARRLELAAPSLPWEVTAIGASWGGVSQPAESMANLWAKGGGIGGEHDQCTFLHQPVDHDFTAIACLAAQRNSDPWAPAGLMVRFGRCSDAASALVYVTPERGVDWQFRSLRGQEAERAGERAGFAAPHYLLVSGSLGESLELTGASSADGTAWTVLGSADLPVVAEPLLVGPAVAGLGSERTGGASFRDVAILDHAVVPPRDLVCRYDGDVTLSWRPASVYETIRIFRYGPGGTKAIAVLGGGKTTYTDRAPVGGLAGSLVYRVVGVVGGMELYTQCSVDAGAPYRVNCGGSPHTDRQGQAWIPDTPFVEDVERTATNYVGWEVANADEDTLYWSDREAGHEGSVLAYRFPVANGSYRVELHFAELCAGCTAVSGPDGVPGNADDGGFGRTFDVKIEGDRVLAGFQPAVAASAAAGLKLPGGEAFVAVVETFVVDVADGRLDIELVDLGGGNPPLDPQISAIAITGETTVNVHTGDANGDGSVDIADGIYLLGFLFMSSAGPPCLKAADANGDDRTDIADAICVLSFLFRSGFMIDPAGNVLTGSGVGCRPYAYTTPWRLDCQHPCEGG